jgi:predicted NBD/HSP70 family sugar kinase
MYGIFRQPTTILGMGRDRLGGLTDRTGSSTDGASAGSKEVSLVDRPAHHRARLLRAVQRQGTASQRDLARTTRLSTSSVSILCRQLQAEGVLELLASEPAGAGRPPIRVRLAAGAGHALGVSVTEREITTVRANIRGEIMSRADRPLGKCRDSKALIAAVAQAVASMTQAPDQPGELLALGVALSGVVDFAAGVFRFSGRIPGPRDVLLREALARRFGVVTVIDDLARARAVAEHRFGVAQGQSDFLYIHADVGIGAGLLLDGHPYRGVRGLAGEIGHLVVDPNGYWCGCGQRGCLEAIATPAALERVARDLSIASVPPSWPAIVAAARSGDRTALNMLTYAAERLGQAMAAAVNLFGVDFIVVGGCLPAASPQVLAVLRQMVQRGSVTGMAPTVQHTTLDEDAAAQGAATLALDTLFAADDHPLTSATWKGGRAAAAG